MRITVAQIILFSSFVLQSNGFFAQAAGQSKDHPDVKDPAVAQTAQPDGNKKLVIIYKGSSKDPAAKISLDGNEKGVLSRETYLEAAITEGSYTITVGEFATRNVVCSRPAVLARSGSCEMGGTVDHVDVIFKPLNYTLVIGKSETTYLLVERNRFGMDCCSRLTSDPQKLVEYRVREINAKDGEKFIKKYRTI